MNSPTLIPGVQRLRPAAVLSLATALLVPPDPGAAQHEPSTCLAASIPFETSTLRTILDDPGRVLREGEEFWETERPLILAQGWADEVGAGNAYGGFEAGVERLAGLAAQERAAHGLSRMTETLVGQEREWAARAIPHLCSYLTDDVDLSRPAYFVAYIPPRAFATSDGIVINVAATYWAENPNNILSSLIHEFFHVGYGQLRRQQSEAPSDNERLYRALDMVQNEGMAVWVAYRAVEDFPAPDEIDNRLLDNPADVNRLLDALNRLLGRTRWPIDPFWGRTAWRVGVTERAYYIVGAHMARTIEEASGREALVRTLVEGPLAYVRLYNSLVAEDQQLRLPDGEAPASADPDA